MGKHRVSKRMMCVAIYTKCCLSLRFPPGTERKLQHDRLTARSERLAMSPCADSFASNRKLPMCSTAASVCHTCTAGKPHEANYFGQRVVFAVRGVFYSSCRRNRALIPIICVPTKEQPGMPYISEHLGMYQKSRNTSNAPMREYQINIQTPRGHLICTKAQIISAFTCRGRACADLNVHFSLASSCSFVPYGAKEYKQIPVPRVRFGWLDPARQVLSAILDKKRSVNGESFS